VAALGLEATKSIMSGARHAYGMWFCGSGKAAVGEGNDVMIFDRSDYCLKHDFLHKDQSHSISLVDFQMYGLEHISSPSFVTSHPIKYPSVPTSCAANDEIASDVAIPAKKPAINFFMRLSPNGLRLSGRVSQRSAPAAC
jgi:hypothetical protein